MAETLAFGPFCPYCAAAGVRSETRVKVPRRYVIVCETDPRHSFVMVPRLPAQKDVSAP